MKKNNILSMITGAVASLLIATVMTGCLGYSLGTALPHDIHAIHVPTFKNQTQEPLLEVSATDATIARFQFDGSLKVGEENNSDAILSVVLKSYKLTPLSYDTKKTTKTREYRATVTAGVILTRRSTDQVILDDPSVTGEATFYLTGDMTSSKKRAIPDLTEDLAKNIVDAVTQTWQ